MKLTTSSARLVISVGKPCLQQTSWQSVQSMDLPTLEPGASVVVPQGRYKMPDNYAGQGWRFRAAIVGPDHDANTANNELQMISNPVLMPDLVLGLGPAQIDASGGVLEIRNAGNAPAGPSRAVFRCQTNDQNISCGHISDSWTPEVVIEYPVPELKPGQTHLLKGLTPKASTESCKTVTWKARADVYYEVVESNEGNNTLTGPKK
jgi:hypothetical protein